MKLDSPVFVAGSQTLIGSAVARRLRQRGQTLVGVEAGEQSRLRDAADLAHFFERARPEYVVHAAGRSGGIGANQRYPAELAHDNLIVTANLFDAARRSGVKRLLYLASSCCYPRTCRQPMSIADLWSGPLEPTNEAYAVAKLAGLALCRAYRQQYGLDFVAGVPANAYGPGDHFDLDDAHVIAALLVRMHEAQSSGAPSVTIWGTGRPRREFVYVDDLADACLAVLDDRAPPPLLNLGGGPDVSIAELAELVRQTVGYQGRLEFDTTRSDGMPRKQLDGRALGELGWRPRTSLAEGLAATYRWYLDEIEAKRGAHVG